MQTGRAMEYQGRRVVWLKIVMCRRNENRKVDWLGCTGHSVELERQHWKVF